MSLSQVDSDTESESDTSVVDATFTAFRPPAPSLAHNVTDEVPTLAEDMLSAIAFLNDLDCERLENDLERIHQASASLLDGMDAAISSPGLCLASEEFCHAFCVLIQVRSLDRLFHLRQVFHIIANKESSNIGSTSSVVCWVDLLLSRLGDAVLALLTPRISTLSAGPTPGVLQEHKERVSLYAALQLPERWSDVVDLIASDYASPAASRLAVRLVFAVYVLPIDLRGSSQQHLHSWPEEGPEQAVILRSLRRFLHRLDTREIVSHSVITEVELATCSMIISLYAVASSKQQEKPPSPLRPHTTAVLLKFIKRIMSNDVSNSPMACQDLTMAQSILLKWGITVPWTWHVWDDERVLDYAVIEFTTNSWLQHLGKHACTWDVTSKDVHHQLIVALAHEPVASCYIITILLLRAVSAVKASPTPSTEDVLSGVAKCCFASSRLLKWLRDSDGALVKKLCQTTMDLWVYLPDTATAIHARDRLLEGLSSAHPDHLRSALEASAAEISFKLKLAENFSNSIRHVNNRSRTCQDVYMIRQSLQFLTIIWLSGSGDHLFEQTGCALVKSAVGYVLTGGLTQPVFGLLLDALLNATTVMSATVDMSKTCEVASMWNVAACTSLPSIEVISASASSLIATINVGKISDLDLVTAWDMFRDFVISVQRQFYAGCDEPLSVIVCSAVLRALEEVAQRATSAVKEYLRMSPWTLSLCESIRLLTREREMTECDHAIQEFLSPLCHTLLATIESILESAVDELPGQNTTELTKDWQLLGYMSDSTFSLLLV